MDQQIAPNETTLPANFFAKMLIRAFLVVAALLVTGLLVYQDFVFGDKTLLYKDIGSDSLNVYYPYYLALSNYLRQFGIPSWSFEVGMGQDLYPYFGTVLLTPLIWLGKAAVAKALVYQHLFYVLIGGLLFSCFLRDRGVNFESSLLGSVLLAFSAYMCMGSCWFILALEVIAYTFVLFAAEKAFLAGRWLYLVVAVLVTGFINAFQLYLCAVLLCLYVPARSVELHSWRSGTIFRSAAFLAFAAVIGVGLGAVISIPNLYGLLNSPRGSGAIANIWPTPKLFQFDTALHYFTAVFRPFSNDILGTGDTFRGWQNYLEAPISYCGLLPLLIFPQAFLRVQGHRRAVYIAFLVFLILPILFPWFRHLFWAFQGDYYREFSLFSIFGIITLSMAALSRFAEERNLNLWLLGGTLAALIALLYLPVGDLKALLDPDIRKTAAILLSIYATLLALGQILNRPMLVIWLIITLSLVELIHFDRMTVSNRSVVTKQELTQSVGYNDETRDTIHELSQSDQSFYRLTKTWGSSPSVHGSLNDAMVFGYYSTSSYSSFNNLNYIKFLIAVDAIPQSDIATRAQWSTGLAGHRLLSAFACEKYVLTKDPAPFRNAPYYEFVDRFGSDVYLFRNQLFLPLGLTFSRFITEKVFSHLPAQAKPLVLLQAAVLSEKDASEQSALHESTADELERRSGNTLAQDIVAELRGSALNITSFGQTQIEGAVVSEENRLIVFQMPFDRGWHAIVDGCEAPTMRVDAGLLGVAIPPGQHRVRLHFRSPFLLTGVFITVLSLCILVVGAWKWPRLELRHD